MITELDRVRVVGRDARNRLEEAHQPGEAGATAALECFYYAFNQRSLAVFDAIWAEDDQIQLNNPLGGIMRGHRPIRDLYERIFSGPAEVWVEFYDFVTYLSENMAIFAGRERGEFTLNGRTVPLAIRTTRVFQYVGPAVGWRQVHHHGSIDDPEALRVYQAAVAGEMVERSHFTAAKVSVASANRPRFEAATTTLLAQSRLEPGVEFFELYQDPTMPENYLFLEKFKSAAAKDAHQAAEHTREWFRLVADLLIAPPVILGLRTAD